MTPLKNFSTVWRLIPEFMSGATGTSMVGFMRDMRRTMREIESVAFLMAAAPVLPSAW